MVVLLHVSHFCCPLFLHKLSEQSGFRIMGRGQKASALRVGAKKVSRKKTARGAEVGRRGRGREILPLHFFSSVFFSSSHYIQPTCRSERLVWNSLNQYKLSLVFILDRAVDTSQISFPNLPSLGFVILQHKVMTPINRINFV